MKTKLFTISTLGALYLCPTLLIAGSSGAPPYGAVLAGSKRNRPNPGYCDYSNAHQNNGWGWNPVTSKPCAPQNNQGYCDFSNAQQNDGWGWNPVTGTSCR